MDENDKRISKPIQPDADVRKPEAPIEGDKLYKLPPAQQAIMFKALADSDPYFWAKIIAGIIIGLIFGFIVRGLI